MGKKIATCSYCGTRAALVFDEGLHELTCRACGAPLHEMKPLRIDPDQPVGKSAAKAKGARPVRYDGRRAPVKGTSRKEWRDWPAKKRKKPKKKALARRVLEELWDVVEDVID